MHKMKLLGLHILLLGCTKMKQASCLAAEDRVKLIKRQRKVFLDLRNQGQLGKKKYKTFDGMLAEEQEIVEEKLKRRCEL